MIAPGHRPQTPPRKNQPPGDSPIIVPSQLWRRRTWWPGLLPLAWLHFSRAASVTPGSPPLGLPAPAGTTGLFRRARTASNGVVRNATRTLRTRSRLPSVVAYWARRLDRRPTSDHPTRPRPMIYGASRRRQSGVGRSAGPISHVLYITCPAVRETSNNGCNARLLCTYVVVSSSPSFSSTAT